MLPFFNFASEGPGRFKPLALGGHSSAACKHTWFSGRKAGCGLRWEIWLRRG